LLGDSARGELNEKRVQATHHPGATVTDVDVAFRQQAQHLAVTDGENRTQLAMDVAR
jgi:hypothetical protein